MTQRLSPAALIRKYYSSTPEAHQILLDHSRRVTKKSLQIARRLVSEGHKVDLQFLAEAAMLHDIGMILTDTPDLGCRGNGPYLLHGIKGKQLLIEEGYPDHAEVCERHIGVGLTVDDIRDQNLPLPERDMTPQTLEQQIISYADLFYSKNSKNRHKEQKPENIRKKMKKFGKGKVEIFDRWLKLFEPHLS